MKRPFESDALTRQEQQQIAEAVAALPATESGEIDRGDRRLESLSERLGEDL